VKSRSPWLMYAAVWLSGGYFSLVWLVLMMRDVNQMERRSAFPVSAIAVVFLLGLSIFFFLAFGFSTPGAGPQATSTVRILLIGILGLPLSLAPFVVLIFVSRYVEKALGCEFRAINAIVLVALSFLMFLSLPVVQRRMNVLAERAKQGGG
jgi:hypothetical protein